MPDNDASTFDIFGLMSEEPPTQENPDEERRKRRQELLQPTGVKELFKDGTIRINKYTCVGAQCRLCVKSCPTNALYWSSGEIGIIEDLCVYCGACVLNCMVDDCIKLERKREDGTVEHFSKPKDVIMLAEKTNCRKRLGRVKAVFPTAESYCDKYPGEPTALLKVLEKANRNPDK